MPVSTKIVIKWVLRKFWSDTFDHHLTYCVKNSFTWDQIVQGVPVNCGDLSTRITASIGVSEPSPYDILKISNWITNLCLSRLSCLTDPTTNSETKDPESSFKKMFNIADFFFFYWIVIDVPLCKILPSCKDLVEDFLFNSIYLV